MSKAVSEAFWQAKIRGLLHNLDISTLKGYDQEKAAPFLQAAAAIIQQPSESRLDDVIDTAHKITDASDRAVLNLANLSSRNPDLHKILRNIRYGRTRIGRNESTKTMPRKEAP